MRAVVFLYKRRKPVFAGAVIFFGFRVYYHQIRFLPRQIQVFVRVQVFFGNIGFFLVFYNQQDNRQIAGNAFFPE
jgi:hypothetical protein